MPLSALTFYIIAKFEHEKLLNNYMADMALYAARPHVQNGESLPRYFDLVKPKPAPEKEEAKPMSDEEVFDVFKAIAEGE